MSRRALSEAAKRATFLPQHIPRPAYSQTGVVPPPLPWAIVHTDEVILRLRHAAKVARKMLDLSLLLAEPGISTDEIDVQVHDAIAREGAYPAPLNYAGFPKSVCSSVNAVVCHGIPDAYVLQAGDIVSFDVSVFYGGVYGDNCGTVIVKGGPEDARGRLLVDVTQKAMDAAITTVYPGGCLTSVGTAISDLADEHKFGVVERYCGHGIGEMFHLPPLVQHTRNRAKFELLPGHVFTIEPMLTEGRPEVTVLEDDWTVVTNDGSRAAQFEHMVLVTTDGYEVLTVLD
ncbi:peptidase M24, structural domain-containing protein [Pelagophyceae sp. CCMP2097]|nr:peptidase M24, structural domain-containing protein [Pelagophyceae sp. CCMP2097]|eukprot:CAMPEP_0184099154 /NCGR_PEP_ID=MMETSP0974-20121125/11677_1 /TAXON_ID=483370 /ORGANISM="non described non described, Strain CCMP2097" /LENGTH=286 /DNA_ID=CAMNT_0026402055 /DNA_START=33 /DNA_END=893 /DNA_ORIENTATION=+